MPIPSIDNVRALGELLTTIKWDITFPMGIPGSDLDPTELSLRCSSTTVPTLKIEFKDINIRGKIIKVPVNAIYDGSIKLELQETANMYVTEGIRQWRQFCYDNQTGIGAPKELSETMIVLTRLNSLFMPVYQYTLFGVTLEGFNPGAMTSLADIIIPGLDLHYDYFLDSIV